MKEGMRFAAGDPREFSIEMSFLPDPDGGRGATPEDAASWGALEIWVNGRNLCLHHSGGAVLEDVHWYLLPVLEWFIEYWDPLLHEERLPFPSTSADARTGFLAGVNPQLGAFDERIESQNASWYEWWGRHALRSCRNGGLLPDLFIRRWRTKVEFAWGNSPLPGTPDDFYFLCPRGTSRQEVNSVSSVLYRVVGDSIDYLASRVAGSVRLEKLRARCKAIPNRSMAEPNAWLAYLGSLPGADETVARYRTKCDGRSDGGST